MTRIWIRTPGFALPTVALVTAGHLVGEASAGEALDGVVSGLYFTALFFVGAWLGARLAGPASVEISWRRAGAEGLLVGLLVWGALWAFWAQVPHEGGRFPANAVFAAHSAIMVVAGLLGAMRRGADRRRTA